MPHLTINSLSVTAVSPEQAAEFLRYNYRKNRRLRADHVAFLAREMAAGRFIETAEIHIMYNKGEPNLVNGQHTCAAIIAHGKPVRVTLRKSTTNEDGQVALTYAFGHDTGKRRIFSDSVGAYDITDQTGLDKTMVDFVASAMRFIRMDFYSTKRKSAIGMPPSPADIIQDVINWAPEAHLFLLHTQEVERVIYKTMRKQGSLSIALITFRYQPKLAAEFWRSVARPDQLHYNDPRVTCRRYLTESVRSQETSGGGSQSGNKLAYLVAECWNSFSRGETREFVRYASGGRRIKIIGTPYTGDHAMGFLSAFPAAIEPK